MESIVMPGLAPGMNVMGRDDVPACKAQAISGPRRNDPQK